MKSAQRFKFQNTSATKKIFSLSKRIRAVRGGTSASKTVSILIWCIDYAQSVRGELISVVSESFPHLSGGAMLDFEMIMKDRNYWEDSRWIKTPKPTYTFATGSKIEFLSVDSRSKAHGPRRDVLFVNECNNLDYEIVDQLITRTRKIVWLDWNPIEEFWFDTEIYGRRDDVDFITLTYLDNEALDGESKREIESHRENVNWWRVYGLGQPGAIETRIYKNWKIIEEIPHEARLVRHWLDFGYSNDPTAIGDVYEYQGGYILQERTYTKGLSNKQIADILLNLEQTLTVADSTEPKSIDEIASYGVSIVGSHKGADSITNGIQLVQAQKISITAQSLNLIKEYRRYYWIKDKNGKILNEPEAGEDHHMDGIRYALTSLLESPNIIRKQQEVFERNQFRSSLNSSK